MKLTKLALAVAATLVAGQAFAAPVTQANVVSARTAGTLKEVWLSGASAPAFNVFDSFARGCDVDTVSIFSNNTAAGKPGALGDYNAYACKRAGVVTVLYSTVNGGSFNAYAPHMPASLGTAPDGSAFPAALQRVKNVGTATCTSSGVYTPTNSPAYLTTTTIPVSYNCTKGLPTALADSAPAKPQGGFSDVEAKLWGYDVSAYGTEAATNVQQAFGIVVTTNLYRALQVAQGIYANVDAANTADSAFSPANAPNITSAQYAAIVQNGGGYQADWSPILGAAGVGKNVNLVRRTGTSGTQASSNAFFLHNPCASGAPAGQTSPAALAQTTATFVVSEQSGTSGVKTALTTINGDATNNFGIGVVSVENTPAAAYKFVKIDGVHPEANDTTNARATMVDGSYKFVMEMNTFIPTVSAGTYAETLINEVAAGLGNPAACTDVGRGMALTPTGGSACAVGTYVSKGTKFGNNCAPMQLFY